MSGRGGSVELQSADADAAHPSSGGQSAKIEVIITQYDYGTVELQHSLSSE